LYNLIVDGKTLIYSVQ